MENTEGFAFEFSRDSLGQAINKYVEGMAQARAEISSLPGDDDGDHDVLHEHLLDVHQAYLDLLDYHLECGIRGREIQIRQDWELGALREENDKLKGKAVE